MVIRVEVTVNGGHVTAQSRNTSMFDSAGNILPAPSHQVLDGSRVTSHQGKYARAADQELSWWNPLNDIEPPRDCVEERAVAALLLSLRSAR